VKSAATVVALAKQLGIKVPICQEM